MSKKWVAVYRYDAFGTSPFPPSGLLEFRGWLDEKIASIPEEFRAGAAIEIGAGMEYDSPVSEFEITYWRPMTPEEEAEERRDMESRRAQQEAKERTALAALKAKYEK